MITIWQVVTHGNGGSAHMMRFHFFGSKTKAKTFLKDWKRDEPIDADAEPEPMQVVPTRVGIADALNRFVHMTCLNEG